ncbi:MAG: hypothetical protein ACRDTU_09550 [Micromonosporaceae bacterium]
MNLDPTMNVVAFKPMRGEPLVASAPTRHDDSIQQAWETVKSEHKVRAFDIVAVTSEWEASDDDGHFLKSTFSNLEETRHIFSRPSADGWEDAFEAARREIARSLAAETPSAGPEMSAEVRDGSMSVDDALRRIAEKAEHDLHASDALDPVELGAGELLPVLRSDSSTGGMRDLLAHQDVAPGLYVSLARFAMTPRGTIGMAHVMQNHLREPDSPSFSELFAQACDNLGDSLAYQVMSNEGELLIQAVLSGKPASQLSSAVVLPGFYEQAAPHLGGGPLIVALPCLDSLLVAAEGSGPAQMFPQMVREHHHPDEHLLPSLLRIDSSGIELLEEWR